MQARVVKRLSGWKTIKALYTVHLQGLLWFVSLF